MHLRERLELLSYDHLRKLVACAAKCLSQRRQAGLATLQVFTQRQRAAFCPHQRVRAIFFAGTEVGREMIRSRLAMVIP